jgi:hypothetical protein
MLYAVDNWGDLKVLSRLEKRASINRTLERGKKGRWKEGKWLP